MSRPTSLPNAHALYATCMPSFDIVSEVDLQEVRNAVDQANREASTRFDFKGTDARIDFSEKELTLAASTEDRLRALYQLLEEKMVKRSVSLKSLDAGKIEEASHGAARQKVTLKAGITQEVGKQINKLIKEMGVKNLSSSIQGDQVRVTGKQRDDLQTAIAAMKEANLDVPLQFTNFRD
ncbi:MAG TPA: YajQ family cyclic di-GMP-binding protein [Acidimicrobiales bacterium]|nr:YajQ family cyclic di-GMP-binding protein [Acidimicrobiales bacterium]